MTITTQWTDQLTSWANLKLNWLFLNPINGSYLFSKLENARLREFLFQNPWNKTIYECIFENNDCCYTVQCWNQGTIGLFDRSITAAFWRPITSWQNWPIRTKIRDINTIIWRWLFTWLWRWLPLRLSKRQSPTTVFLKTTLTRTITRVK